MMDNNNNHEPNKGLYYSTQQTNLSMQTMNIPKTTTTTTNKKKKKKNKELSAGYEPGNYDVLCGRGKSALNHIGNRRFRTVVAYHLPKYLALKSRSDKTSLAMKIVASVRSQGGQFLKQDPDTHVWYEIGDKMARDKVAHALRDAKADRTLKKPQPLPHSEVADLIRATTDDDGDTDAAIRDYQRSSNATAALDRRRYDTFLSTPTMETGRQQQQQLQKREQDSCLADLQSRLSPEAALAAREDPSSITIADILLHLSMSRGAPTTSTPDQPISSSSTKQNLVSA
uniref:DUF6824 domain-containing protein n=1 Tax=Cyclophora tenuis TaxID=216820 RepID=A0A6U1PBE7_CYCTE|mmetsp:Transcript_13366/g.22749  ORF Transcript_13366/g.22749 Transcript_13366/m.22749 type:complete len:285 (+) Transcript_13366:88-942(+)